MELPNTEIETFIKYSQKVAALFKNLRRGAHTERNPKYHLPSKAHPYLHWYTDSIYEDYIFYGHNKNFEKTTWTLFSLDNIEIGEL